jgi:hypothetical protein
VCDIEGLRLEWRMHSKVAQQSQRALLELHKQLTAEQRLEAFLRHSRLMAALRKAGEEQRLSTRARGQV